ncbi:hypothetical protein MNBD_NITROSPINAE01-825 [hydrothermal vent metagenome]|uniref:Two-component transcriptional response regulator, LuxR family n=1 Tax=hydrothermal vent metagenome TaxID=652676 RepID=A0A3B1CCZ2_9ZZZZ
MKVVILEDEPVAARQLEKMLRRMDGLNISSISICDNARDGREKIKEGLDLLFLDLNLRGEAGFDVLKEFLSEPFETIITTAYPDHALEAFQYGVRDYLVKPFSGERLHQAVSRVPMPEPYESPALMNIMVKDRETIIPVSVDDIKLIRSAGDYCELYLVSGKQLLCSKRMDFLAHRLPDDFMRIHRTVIVRITQISGLKVEGGGRYFATVHGVLEPVPVGRKYYKDIKAKLGDGEV